MSDNPEAVRLKDRGNALYCQGEYEQALDLYTQALELLDDSNPILLTNRAACYNMLKKFNEGMEDAYLATHYDPNYYKAWWRLAEAQDALCYYYLAAENWRRAMQALPSSPTASQRSHGEYFMLSMKASTEKDDVASREKMRKALGIPPGSAPWERAEAVRARRDVAKDSSTSCVGSLLHASTQFNKGLEILAREDFHRQDTNFAVDPCHVPDGALLCLSEALLTDERAALLHDKHYVDRVKRLITYEVKKSGAPDPGRKFEEIISAIQQLQTEGGWDRVRPAIEAIVRSLVLRGDISVSLRVDFETGYKILNKAVKIITWGRAEWAHTTEPEHGSIIAGAFLANLQRAALIAYRGVLIRTRRRNSQYSVAELLERSAALIDFARGLSTSGPKTSGPGPDVDGLESMTPGVAAAWIVYSQAQAHSLKAWCLSENVQAGGTTEERKALRRAVIDSYLTAASLYPEDEEWHGVELHNVLINHFLLRSPLRDTVPVMERIRRVVPRIMEIWEYSNVMGGSLKEDLEKVETFAAGVQEAMNEGRRGYGDLDVVVPKLVSTPYSEVQGYSIVL
ncbi:TPR-like protein [Artomyces pyxidatus]|uniref:TPR-like protein n=1 Tax=Artomyces pyxidatus TaxID=48021 RepID=A0ACB8TCV8_9AGAM|nr:TPR-like protein [Artomyces pyxidatus]